MPKSIFISALIFVPLFLGTISGSAEVFFISLIAVIIANPIIWKVRKDRYFSSDEFKNLKQLAQAVIAEHNSVVNYIAEIRGSGTFEIGTSSTGQYAHLASFENQSSWNYRRDRNIAEYAPHVHHASLQVVRNASVEPVKYLIKYFSISPNRETLREVQRVAESISRLENAISNVKHREAYIAHRIHPPEFILERYEKEFWSQVGANLPAITIPYPEYKFQYTSAGGNSSQVCRIRLNTPTLDALSSTLADKIRWTKSQQGQRALMTARLRKSIKERDGYTCRNCKLSVTREPHLLLEIDHITPISKGGLSVPSNLQTLCWKCNRSKGSKLTVPYG